MAFTESVFNGNTESRYIVFNTSIEFIKSNVLVACGRVVGSNLLYFKKYTCCRQDFSAYSNLALTEVQRASWQVLPNVSAACHEGNVGLHVMYVTLVN
jgi:hypothetical protein